MDWKRMMLLFNSILGVLLGLLTYGFLNFNQPWELGLSVLSALVGVSIVLSSYFISKVLDRKIGWKSKTGMRLFAGLILCILLSLLIVKAIFYKLDFSHFIKGSILICTYSILYNIVYFMFFSYHEYVHGHIQQQEFQTRQAQLQLDALKSQLSPHFLFNSLNALSALFHKNLGSAERFIRSLAYSYKYVLENYEHPLVSVEKEVEFTKSYFEMMKIRFGENLELFVDVDSELINAKIPPLTLQMLVDNAVKHNRIDSETPLHIYIKSSLGHLIVSNEKALKFSDSSSTKVGLRNISDRYDLLNMKGIMVEESDVFSVQIPVVQ